MNSQVQQQQQQPIQMTSGYGNGAGITSSWKPEISSQQQQSASSSSSEPSPAIKTWDFVVLAKSRLHHLKDDKVSDDAQSSGYGGQQQLGWSSTGSSSGYDVMTTDNSGYSSSGYGLSGAAGSSSSGSQLQQSSYGGDWSSTGGYDAGYGGAMDQSYYSSG